MERIDFVELKPRGPVLWVSRGELAPEPAAEPQPAPASNEGNDAPDGFEASQLANDLRGKLDAAEAEIAALKARPPEVRTEYVTVEAPAAVEAVTELYVPDFTLIPEGLAKYAEADETAEDFRRRAFNLLFRFGIAEGENFEGGGEPLTAEEKINLLPMLIANFEAGNWLNLKESLKPN